MSGPVAGHRDEMIDGDGMAERDERRERPPLSLIGECTCRPVFLVCNVDVLVCNLEQPSRSQWSGCEARLSQAQIGR